MKLAGKKILVTGADGFIGSHLCEKLLEQGVNVLRVGHPARISEELINLNYSERFCQFNVKANRQFTLLV